VSEKTFESDDSEEVIGEITHGAFANPLMSEVLAKFGRRAFARTSMCMEFEAFLRRIGASGKTCLEIGSYNGITGIILSQYFDKVICVSYDPDKRHIIKPEIVESLGIENIEFHDVESNEHKRELVDSMDFDFCYSDGDHCNDARDDFDLVKRCGRVLLHEYWPIQPPVWNLVNSLPPHEVTRAQFDCLAYWQRADLGRVK
jgi:predicted O-methyltransferase YrrM